MADIASSILPGVALCVALFLVAAGLEGLEIMLTGGAWLESLVLAILVGTTVRTAWTPGARWRRGIAFSARTLLEIAVMLLGASLSLGTLVAAGPVLIAGIALTVILALGLGYGIGRTLGLPPRMATLVACGNAICGNSAIAAVAPVIGADGEDVSASIAFTAVLGVLCVILLPATIPLLHFSLRQYGIFAGLTVYAVPQVLAATVTAGPLAMQVGTLVKLVRVLMLGPVVLLLSLAAGRRAPRRLPLRRLVPWFILGFLGLAGLRALGLLPEAALAPAADTATVLTVISMAALGLHTDMRMLLRAGSRVTLTVTLSLLALGATGFGLIRLLALA